MFHSWCHSLINISFSQFIKNIGVQNCKKNIRVNNSHVRKLLNYGPYYGQLRFLCLFLKRIVSMRRQYHRTRNIHTSHPNSTLTGRDKSHTKTCFVWNVNWLLIIWLFISFPLIRYSILTYSECDANPYLIGKEVIPWNLKVCLPWQLVT